VGAGLQIMRATLDLTKDLDFVNSEGSARIAGAAWGVGANVGVQAEVIEKRLSAGLQYRSAVKLSAQGQADFQNIPLEFQSQLKDQKASAAVTVPGQVSASLAFKPLERLTLAVEANWVEWSTFREFSVEFEDASLNQPLAKRWKDTWNYHVGAEYGVTKDLNVRAGFVYDPSPSPSWSLTPDLPDANRTAVTVGAGYAFGALKADVGYQYVILSDKHSTAVGIPGNYSGKAHVLALTLGYSM
jgi:long-chain fatty acid transport protein